MTKKIAFAVAVISALSSFAHAEDNSINPMPNDQQMVMLGTTLAPTATTMFPTMLSEGTSKGFKKEIIAAQDDIANFVASNGEIRTAQFEHAMELVREMNNVQSAQDMELAQAVLGELQ